MAGGISFCPPGPLPPHSTRHALQHLSGYRSCRGLSKTAVELSLTTECKYNTDDDGIDEQDAATSFANEMDL